MRHLLNEIQKGGSVDDFDKLRIKLASPVNLLIFKMKLASKEEVDILNKRISNLEKKIEKKNKRKKINRVKK